MILMVSLRRQPSSKSLDDEYSAFCWDAGDSPAVTTNSGGVTMSTLVKANVDKGFSVCRYDGGGGNNSYSHGLGKAPISCY